MKDGAANAIWSQGQKMMADDIALGKSAPTLPFTGPKGAELQDMLNYTYAQKASEMGVKLTTQAGPPLQADLTDKAIQSAASAEARRQRTMQGRASTFLTGPGGTLANKTLLGG